MKPGDIVRFINRNHTMYHQLCSKAGIVVEIDESIAYCRPYNQRHYGAKVVVVFENNPPTAYTRYSLEVVKNASR